MDKRQEEDYYQLRIDPQLKKRAMHLAKIQGITLAGLIRVLLNKAIDRRWPPQELHKDENESLHSRED